ncbi:hypothetical protein [Bifidobacterium eulemuris]|uniref:Uncharacterized protein n=1 Tax=Bifidobacterium eulemuris TaxID=1765219 RepID=A0A261G9X7_9BIFI|nr:hypothetical protein [Bifidobacterium eulemuris]OZG68237.1 hypothetical protein BEUL_1250 [Bifidobacterium eulemuris]QOL31707.1 hypothetical protein BE0216_03940 [Bifidobacterium eulemuris]
MTSISQTEAKEYVSGLEEYYGDLEIASMQEAYEAGRLSDPTDTEVEAAAEAMHDATESLTWHDCRDLARIALAAARKAVV